MEVGLYLPVYSRSFRGGNTIFSPWRLSRFVTKLNFKYKLAHNIKSDSKSVYAYVRSMQNVLDKVG